MSYAHAIWAWHQARWLAAGWVRMAMGPRFVARLMEKLCAAAREDLRLGLLSPTMARQLTRLPAGNQQEALETGRRHSLSAAELRGVVDLLLVSGTREKEAFVLERPRQALCDPDYETTLAYMLQSFEIFRNDNDMPLGLRRKLGNRLAAGTRAILDLHYANGYFYLSTHPETKNYYSLLALEILLGIDSFVQEADRLRLSYELLQRIARSRVDGGVPLGGGNKARKYALPEIGTSARFLAALRLLATAPHALDAIGDERVDAVQIWIRESEEYLRRCLLSYNQDSFNLMTHGFEALLCATVTCTIQSESLAARLVKIDELVASWRDQKSINVNDVNRYGIAESDFAKAVLKRDMLHLPSRC